MGQLICVGYSAHHRALIGVDVSPDKNTHNRFSESGISAPQYVVTEGGVNSTHLHDDDDDGHETMVSFIVGKLIEST